jgi:RNA polymerase sigma factor (sigma-70 family)
LAQSIDAIEFGKRLMACRQALYKAALAATHHPQDAEDLVEKVIENALFALEGFDEVDAATGPSRTVNWLFRILRHAISDYRRRERRRREISLEQSLEGGAPEWEWRWATLACQTQRAQVADMELIAEIRFRLRYAELTHEERVSVLARAHGIKLKVIAAELQCSPATACRRIRSAIVKLRACPVGAFIGPDLDRYAWRVGGLVPLYYAPPKTGAMLAREQLARLTLPAVTPPQGRRR